MAQASDCVGICSEDPIGFIELNIIHPHVSLPSLELPHACVKKESEPGGSLLFRLLSKVHVLHNLTGH